MIGSKYLSEVVSLDMLAKDKMNIVKAPTGNAGFHRIKSSQKIIQIRVGNDLFCLILNQVAIINRHIEGWGFKFPLDAVRGCRQRNNLRMPVPHSFFNAILGNRMMVRSAFSKVLELDEAMKFIADDVFKLFVEIGILFHQNAELGVGDDYDAVIIFKVECVTIDLSFPISVNRTRIVVFEDLRLAVDGVNQIHHFMRGIGQSCGNCGQGEIGLSACYVSRISMMKTVEENARQEGLNPISIWSIRNCAYPLSEEQMRVRQHILDNFGIPAEYHLLIINASSETSLKIKSSVDYVIVHSNEEETQIQVRGRVNSDLPCLYLPNNDPTALTVPDDFLNRPLFREDTDKLCEILNQRNECGRRYAWRRPLKEQLIECGYSIADGRKNNRRYSLITQFE